jgi:ATP-dependent helicase HrpB
MKNFPIDEIIPRLKQSFSIGNAIVLHAPPGAGKTTRVPLALLDVIKPGQKIIMLEPRRIAAVSAARWMSKNIGEEVGQTIGYAIRFERKVSERTRVEVVTEGILTRRIQSDPALEGIAMVIFDEFHERSIHADLALALCLDIQRNLREDLKIIVMSATMDCLPVAGLLGNAPIISSEGRHFSVDERYCENIRHEFLPAQVTRSVKQALKETEGDILAFLPGAGEIRSCAGMLAEEIGRDISIHQLYGDMPLEEQEKAILSGAKRKIVLATNIAETSLTIEGVHVVIDSGLTKRLQHDPATGMNRLMTVRASKASAEQRKGRAGRLAPGVCYRLYSRHTFNAMIDYNPPEILISDLSSLVLDLALWGVKDMNTLSWLNPPLSSSISSAKTLLMEIGALDAAGSATSAGKKMAQLPVHPRMARLIRSALDAGYPSAGSHLAAVLAERDIFRHGRNAYTPATSESDIMDRIETVYAFSMNKDIDPNADKGAIRSVLRTAKQLLAMIKYGNEPEHVNAENISRLLLSAYPDRLGKQRQAGSDRYLLANGRGAKLSPKSAVRNRPYIVAVNVDAGDAGEGIIHLASSVSGEMIRQVYGRRIELRSAVSWDQKEGRVIATQEERFGAIALSTMPFTASDAEAATVICEVVRASNLGMLNFNPNVRQLQGQIRLLRKVMPGGGWPDISDEHLKNTPEQWLSPFLRGIRNQQGLSALELLPALKTLLTREQQKRLNELAPAHITVPSGSSITLDYASGDIPVLAVKLQEMFGLADTPVVAGGRVKVLLHLLSPARRPIQVTQDLKGFWNNIYPQVKKELKGRYPKHPWPDDPWNAVPTRGIKRKNAGS